MRLQAFRIQGYKSITDSGLCRISDTDNIVIIAGQNESGKSAILQALRDCEVGELTSKTVKNFLTPEWPKIEMIYHLEEDGELGTVIKQEELKGVSEEALKYLNTKTTLHLIWKFNQEGEAVISFDEETRAALQSLLQVTLKEQDGVNEAAKDGENSITAASTEQDVEKKEEVTMSEKIAEIAETCSWYTPKTIFFDDLKHMLPDRILLKDLKEKNKKAEGYTAVKNIEAILDVDFTHFDSIEGPQKNRMESDTNTKLTADFNEYWKQKIHDDNKVTICIRPEQGRSQDGAYLDFFILTKDGEYLTPGQRSRGFQWFLSFYLQLKAASNTYEDSSLLILFDEPGLYLHARAQADIKGLFEELALKHQIIYSTHSPYLIDTDKLSRVKLAINDKEKGTVIEKTSTMIGGQKKLDAMKPIIDAMGLEVAQYLSPVSKRNVIVEGVSDFYYFLGIKKLLSETGEYAFIPSMGAHNVHLLIEMCMGWGLEWLAIFDDDTASRKAVNNIKKDLAGDDAFLNRIAIFEGLEGIEEAFTERDLKLVRSDINKDQVSKKQAAADGSSSVTNKAIINFYGGKELFARQFLEKVNNNDIVINKLSKKCTDIFIKKFKFIKEKFELD